MYCAICSSKTTTAHWETYLGYLCSKCRRISKAKIEEQITKRAEENLPFIMGEIAKINIPYPHRDGVGEASSTGHQQGSPAQTEEQN